MPRNLQPKQRKRPEAAVSAAGMRIIRLLVGCPPKSIAELIDATEVTRTAVTEQLSELVAAGFVERTIQRYGIPPELVVGSWAGRLDNDGDSIQLENAAGSIITSVRYRDGGGWPEDADGFGPSLELVSPRFDFDFPEKWAARDYRARTKP